MPDGVIFALPLASFVAAVFLKCRSKDSESNRIRQMLFIEQKLQLRISRLHVLQQVTQQWLLLKQTSVQVS